MASYVARLGLEPRQTVPKTGVLPLDDRALKKLECKFNQNYFSIKN